MADEDCSMRIAPAIVITNAPDPFNSPKADIILRTSDDVDFRVKKAVVSVASSVFEDMFAALPSSDGGALPIVTLPEDGSTLDALLRYCYPVDRPAIETMDQAQSVLEAGMKYQVKVATDALRKTLFQGQYSESQPVRCFALAYRFALDQEAGMMARRMLKLTIMDIIDSPPEHLRHISGETYARLLHYHRECGRVAADLIKLKPGAVFEWINRDEFIFLTCKDCEGDPDSHLMICRVPGGREVPGRKLIKRRPRKWWADYMRDMELELRRRPDGSTVINDKGLLARCVMEASACINCGPYALQDMEQFTTPLAEKVDEVVSEVEFQVLFLELGERPAKRRKIYTGD